MGRSMTVEREMWQVPQGMRSGQVVSRTGAWQTVQVERGMEDILEGPHMNLSSHRLVREPASPRPVRKNFALDRHSSSMSRIDRMDWWANMSEATRTHRTHRTHPLMAPRAEGWRCPRTEWLRVALTSSPRSHSPEARWEADWWQIWVLATPN